MTRLPYSPALLALLLLINCLPAPAQAADESEALYFGAMPMVLTVSRLPQPQSEAPGSVTILDRELIRASGARHISDLLRLVPGFQVTPPNNDPARVTYHGLGEEFPSRMQVLVDGRPQYSSLYQGGVNWNLMPVAIDDIERIEVIRGSNSAAFGSNAFLGVVNIITLDASQVQGASVFGNHGSNGLRDYGVRWGGKVGDMNVRLTYQQQRDRGVYGTPSDRNQQLFDMRGDWQLTARDELQVSAGQVETATVNGRPNRPSDPLRTFTQRSSHLQLGWRHITDSGSEWQTRYSHVEDWGSDAHMEYWNQTIDPVRGPEPFAFFVDYGGRSFRDEFEIQRTSVPSETTRLVWGVGLKNEGVRSPLFYTSANMTHRMVSRLFGNLEWRASPAWLVNAGATLEHDSQSGPTLAPRINASYHLTTEQTLRAGISRAYRTPSLMETRSDARFTSLDGRDIEREFLGNPGLKPEQLTAFEIGYLGDFRAQRSSLDVRVFEERIRDRILATPQLSPQPCDLHEVRPGFPCGGVQIFMNAERMTVRGIEYQWRWQPFDSTRLLVNQAHLHISSELQDVQMYENPDNIAKFVRQTLQSAPRRSTTVMLMQKLPWGLDASVTYHHVDDVRWTLNTRVDAYRRVDYRVAYPFTFGRHRAELAYTVQTANAPHTEFRPNQFVREQHWLSLRMDM